MTMCVLFSVSVLLPRCVSSACGSGTRRCQPERVEGVFGDVKKTVINSLRMVFYGMMPAWYVVWEESVKSLKILLADI
ncbi:hypothetical protein B0H12DRAFT_1084415 [Mycena haematopus]|nr:hypothetical protein B0H12DRAFT_1165474 [Mycena haematopus]KAJ7276258.1 hypothetical protein B0H12DRAFT_1084415 [Mycena haematopus]